MRRAPKFARILLLLAMVLPGVALSAWAAPADAQEASATELNVELFNGGLTQFNIPPDDSLLAQGFKVQAVYGRPSTTDRSVNQTLTVALATAAVGVISNANFQLGGGKVSIPLFGKNGDGLEFRPAYDSNGKLLSLIFASGNLKSDPLNLLIGIGSASRLIPVEPTPSPSGVLGKGAMLKVPLDVVALMGREEEGPTQNCRNFKYNCVLASDYRGSLQIQASISAAIDAPSSTEIVFSDGSTSTVAALGMGSASTALAFDAGSKSAEVSFSAGRGEISVDLGDFKLPLINTTLTVTLTPPALGNEAEAYPITLAVTFALEPKPIPFVLDLNQDNVIDESDGLILARVWSAIGGYINLFGRLNPDPFPDIKFAFLTFFELDGTVDPKKSENDMLLNFLSSDIRTLSGGDQAKAYQAAAWVAQMHEAYPDVLDFDGDGDGAISLNDGLILSRVTSAALSYIDAHGYGPDDPRFDPASPHYDQSLDADSSFLAFFEPDGTLDSDKEANNEFLNELSDAIQALVGEGNLPDEDKKPRAYLAAANVIAALFKAGTIGKEGAVRLTASLTDQNSNQFLIPPADDASALAVVQEFVAKAVDRFGSLDANVNRELSVTLEDDAMGVIGNSSFRFRGGMASTYLSGKDALGFRPAYDSHGEIATFVFASPDLFSDSVSLLIAVNAASRLIPVGESTLSGAPGRDLTLKASLEAVALMGRDGPTQKCRFFEYNCVRHSDYSESLQLQVSMSVAIGASSATEIVFSDGSTSTVAAFGAFSVDSTLTQVIFSGGRGEVSIDLGGVKLPLVDTTLTVTLTPPALGDETEAYPVTLTFNVMFAPTPLHYMLDFDGSGGIGLDDGMILVRVWGALSSWIDTFGYERDGLGLAFLEHFEEDDRTVDPRKVGNLEFLNTISAQISSFFTGDSGAQRQAAAWVAQIYKDARDRNERNPSDDFDFDGSGGVGLDDGLILVRGSTAIFSWINSFGYKRDGYGFAFLEYFEVDDRTLDPMKDDNMQFLTTLSASYQSLVTDQSQRFLGTVKLIEILFRGNAFAEFE